MTLLKEPDYGTPAKDGPATVSLEVDGLGVLPLPVVLAARVVSCHSAIVLPQRGLLVTSCCVGNSHATIAR